MTIPQAWMPPSLSPEEKDGFAAAFPNDPHGAAAAAWESYAATLPAEAAVTGVSTGAQSITYAKGSSPFADAQARADFHRARSCPYTTPVGGDYAKGHVEDPDLFDGGVIETYPSLPMMGPTTAAVPATGSP